MSATRLPAKPAFTRATKHATQDSIGRYRCGDCHRLCTVYDLFGIVFADCRAGHYDVLDLGQVPPVRVEPKPQLELPGLS